MRLSVWAENTRGYQADPNWARSPSAKLDAASCPAAPLRLQYGSGSLVVFPGLKRRAGTPEALGEPGADPSGSPELCMKHTKGQTGSQGTATGLRMG